MSQNMNENKEVVNVERKNGYYIFKDKNLASVTTIMRSGGDSGGLTRWAAKQGGHGVIWGLSKVQDAEALKARLGSPACLEWATEQAVMGLESEGNRVKDFGSRVHSGIECRLTSQELNTQDWSDSEKQALETAWEFYAKTKFNVLGVENILYSEENRYAGRCDLIAEINADSIKNITPFLTRTSDNIEDEGVIIADFKTGTLFVPTLKEQLAAYAAAYEAEKGVKVVGGLIIGVERDNPTKVKCIFFNRETLVEAFHMGFLKVRDVFEWRDAPRWYLKQWENDKKKTIFKDFAHEKPKTTRKTKEKQQKTENSTLLTSVLNA